MRVKLFYGSTFTLESLINEWLQQNPDITVRDIKFSTDPEWKIALLMYEPRV